MRTQHRWRLQGSWIFESGDNGEIFYYPHGWGRAYVIPTENKRREIEESLTLWRAKLQSIMEIAPWTVLPLMLMFAAGFPPICRIFWYVPWHTLLRSALVIGALGLLVILGSPMALRFLAETAKADLEKATKRRPFVESLKDYAKRSDWWVLLSEEATFVLFLLVGGNLLWPRSESVILPAQVNLHALPLGLALLIIGMPMAATKLWQIRAKFREERRSG